MCSAEENLSPLDDPIGVLPATGSYEKLDPWNEKKPTWL